MFGLVITTEAHLTSRWCQNFHVFHNTTEMSAIDEALSFLGPHGLVARTCELRVFMMIANMLLVCVWARWSSPHTCPAGTCVPTVDAESPAQVYGLPMQHVYGHT